MDTVRNLLAMLVLAIVVSTGICPILKALDTGWHADLQAQSEHWFHHRRPSVHGVPLRSGRGGPPQAYQGALNMVGLNIGITAGGILNWAVLAPTDGIPAGALAGEYVGASGDVGFIVGVGTNVLIGGSARTLALQPVSVEGSVGANVALGVSGTQAASSVLISALQLLG